MRQGTKAAAVGLMALGCAASAPALADGTLYGGELVTQPQLHVEAGYPMLGAGYRVPVGATLEIKPYARFAYFAAGAGVAALEPGVEARLAVLDEGDFRGALTFAVPVHMAFGGGLAMGVGLGHPGFAVTYAPTPQVDLDVGIRFEDNLYFTSQGTVFSAALPLVLGVEGDVGELRMGFKFEGGPSFASSRFGTVGGAGVVRAVFGVGFDL